MIIENITHLQNELARHRAAIQTIEKQISKISVTLSVMGDEITPAQTTEMVDALSMSDYISTDTAVRDVFAATDPIPEPTIPE